MLRIVIGITASVIGIFVPLLLVWKVIALLVAGIALLTATIGFCPLNALLGVDTCRKGDHR